MEYNRPTALSAPIVSLKDENDSDIYFALARIDCDNLTNLYGVEVSFYGSFATRPDVTIIAFNNSNACNTYLTSLFAEGQFTWPEDFGTLNEEATPLNGSISNYVINKKTIASNDTEYPDWPAPMGMTGCYYNPNIVKPINANQIYGGTGSRVKGYIHVLVLFSTKPSFETDTPTMTIKDKDGVETEVDKCDIAIVYGRQE